MKILKNVSCEYDRRVVETQLCKLRGTYANFYETVENSPTQGQLNPRKKYDKKWHLGHFFPQQIFFRGSGLVYITRNLTQPNYPQTPYYWVAVVLWCGPRMTFCYGRGKALSVTYFRSTKHSILHLYLHRLITYVVFDHLMHGVAPITRSSGWKPRTI